MNHHEGTKDTKPPLRVMRSGRRHPSSSSRRRLHAAHRRAHSRREAPVLVRLHSGETSAAPHRPLRSLLHALRAFVVPTSPASPMSNGTHPNQSPTPLTLFKEHS